MEIEDQLVQALQASLGSAINSSLNSASKSWDLFEAFVLGIVLDAARDLGAQVEYRNHTGPTTDFVFRTSPGYIFSTAQPYTHAYIQFPGWVPPLEAHMSVLVSSSSNVLHECDVSVLHHSEAETCRRNRVHPRAAKLVFAVECKFYTVPLALNLARAFLGLGVELGVNRTFIVVNNSSDTIERLLAHQRSGLWEHQLVPTAPGVITRLRNTFQQQFKDYIARNK